MKLQKLCLPVLGLHQIMAITEDHKEVVTHSMAPEIKLFGRTIRKKTKVKNTEWRRLSTQRGDKVENYEKARREFIYTGQLLRFITTSNGRYTTCTLFTNNLPGLTSAPQNFTIITKNVAEPTVSLKISGVGTTKSLRDVEISDVVIVFRDQEQLKDFHKITTAPYHNEEHQHHHRHEIVEGCDDGDDGFPSSAC